MITSRPPAIATRGDGKGVAHRVDMHTCHRLRHLLADVLDRRFTIQVNVGSGTPVPSQQA